MSFSSESLKTPGHVNAFISTVQITRRFLETLATISKDTWISLYDRYPFFVLYRKNLPYLLCLVTVQITGLQTLAYFLWCIFQQE